MPPLLPFFALLWFLRALWRGLKDPEIRAYLFWVIVVVGTGAAFYHHMENWSWLDSLYFAVITLTTIGYGDLTPTQPLSKIFTMGYVLVGLGFLAAFIDLIATRRAKMLKRNQAK